MMRYIKKMLVVTLGAMAAALAGGCLASSGEAVIRLDEASLKQMGTVRIDPDARLLVVTGFVNQVTGAIELLACSPSGKTHESVLVLQARPRDLHAGLLLLGLRHGDPMPGLGKGPPTGDAVDIRVLWEQDGETVELPAEALVYDYSRRKPARHDRWIFNGSMIENGVFRAETEQSMIATYWDPWSIINLEADIGMDDEVLGVNTGTVPPLRQPVTVVIRPASGKHP